MRLIDLNPRWCMDADIVVGGRTIHDDQREGMGLSFNCPCCLGTSRETRLAVFISNPIDNKLPSDDAKCIWHRVGDTFETLTLSPSIDVSKYGHWHGRIVNGQIV